MTVKKYAARFQQLKEQFDAVLATKGSVYSAFTQSNHDTLDGELAHEWRVKARSLISMACGESSLHLKEFVESEKPQTMEGPVSLMKRLGAVFNAVRDDYEGGYLSSFKSLVQAEVFDNELEQASELLSSGYHVAAAVIARTVLETAIADLCERQDPKILRQKLAKMNDDLAKAGVYNSLRQKKILALSAVGNSAAHGKHDEFSAADVKSMISDIRDLIDGWLSD
ncbi:hypothetical protein Jab_2c20450 [Janthinobacterium sp. HH01]|uniref:DUF4145 domain-containing protein n=1 Tax=Janthinobacterium sp. HH01 TaxID=1198452 RepID=UPI0002AEBBDE|nr:DUF4145 domain-containing protein [Janthinobacterium sp. HH01]ELX09961.1 hypothetical protein Jab_2c20450 [Janthinobacterium sp. HH01]